MPRSEEQNQIIRDVRREEILRNAMTVFARKGYAASKISDVAKSASLSPGLVYHYFDSKEEMFLAVLDQTLELTNDAIKEIALSPIEPIEKMNIITQKYFDDIGTLSLRWLLLLQIGLTEGIPQKAQDLFKEKFAVLDIIQDIFKEGQDKGQFKSEIDAATLTTSYWSVIQGMSIFRVFDFGDYKAPDIEMIFKSLNSIIITVPQKNGKN